MPGPSPKRPTPRRANRKNSNRKNSNWGPSAVAAAIAVVVFGSLIFMMSRSPAVTASANGAASGTTTSADHRLASEPTTNRLAPEPTTNRTASKPTMPARTVATATAATQQQAGAVKRETRPAANRAAGPSANRDRRVRPRVADGPVGHRRHRAHPFARDDCHRDPEFFASVGGGGCRTGRHARQLDQADGRR